MCQKYEWNRARDQKIDEQHYVLLREAVSKPSQQQSANNAEAEDERQDLRCLRLGVVAVKAQKELEALLRSTHRSDRTHAPNHEQREGKGFERLLHVGRCSFGLRPGHLRGIFYSHRKRHRYNNDEQSECLQSPVPPKSLDEKFRYPWNSRSTDSDPQVR